MRFNFYSNALQNVGWDKLYRSADAYRHCLNIINAFSVKKRQLYKAKTSFSCQMVVSGNKAKVAKIPCHTKLVNPVSNRGRFLSLDILRAFFFHEIRLTSEML